MSVTDTTGGAPPPLSRNVTDTDRPVGAVAKCNVCRGWIDHYDDTWVWWHYDGATIFGMPKHRQVRGCAACAKDTWTYRFLSKGYGSAYRMPCKRERCEREVVLLRSLSQASPERRYYCSDQCQQLNSDKLKNRTRRCQQCGATFTPKRSDSKTCSSRCRQKAYRDRNKAAPSTTGRVASRAVYENIHSMN